MIKIECDLSDIESLANRLILAEKDATEANTLYCAKADKVWALQAELLALKKQVAERLPLTIPGSASAELRLIITAITKCGGDVGSSERIPAIKAVRALTALGLKEAKDLVEEAIKEGTSEPRPELLT